MSWKILFFLWKRNKLITKLFLYSIKLVYMFIYMYISVFIFLSWIYTCMKVYMYFHIPIVIFNWQWLRTSFYFPTEGVIFRIYILFPITFHVRLLYRYMTALLHGILAGVCGLIHVLVYVMNREGSCRVKPFGSIFLVRNESIMKLLPLIIFFRLPFRSDMLSSCTPFIVYVISISVNKTSVILFGM